MGPSDWVDRRDKSGLGSSGHVLGTGRSLTGVSGLNFDLQVESWLQRGA